MDKQQAKNHKRPLPFWLKIVIKSQKMHIQFLKDNSATKAWDLLEAQKYLRWLQKQVEK